jgi:ribose 5-phosphate isomerase B
MERIMRIVLGNDHAAVEMKQAVLEYLKEAGHEVINIGTDTADRCHYPEIAAEAAEQITGGKAQLGILICGTGIGMSIAANKTKGIRAAVCSEAVSARLSREHNHANIICFGARIIGNETAFSIIDAFLKAEPLGGRHQERVEMIMNREQ